jgi:arylsulfatase A-like enzyme
LSGNVNDDIITNVDLAQTFLDYAGTQAPPGMQGHSLRPLLEGETPSRWQDAVYYRYWMHHADHNVAAHYGIRTKTHKLIYYYADPMDQPGTDGGLAGAGRSDPNAPLDLEPEWELFDPGKDPLEMNSVHDDPAYSGVVRELTEKLHALQASVGDERHHTDTL